MLLSHKISFPLRVSLFWLIIAICRPAFGQFDVDRMFKKYSTKDGLLSNSIHDLTESRNGLWWIGTPAGLQRFNGYSFETWNSPLGKDSVPSLAAERIFEDSKGNVWVFNPQSNYVFESGKQKYIPVRTDSTLPGNLSISLTYLQPVMESNGHVWAFQNNTGFLGFNINTLKLDKYLPIQQYTKNPAIGIYALAFSTTNADGTAWVVQDFADSNYVFHFNPSAQEAVKVISLPVNKFGALKALIPVGNHQMLFISTRNTALCYESDLTTPIKILSNENIPGQFVHNLVYERLKGPDSEDSRIIFPGVNGLYIYSPKHQTLEPYATAQYPQINTSRQLMFAIKEDSWGNIWIGRDATDGLLVFFPGKLKFNFITAPKRYFTLVYSLASDKCGNVYASNFQKGINVFDKTGRWVRYIDIPIFKDGQMVSMRTMNFIDSTHVVMKSGASEIIILNTATNSITNITPLVPKQVASQRNVFDATFTPYDKNALHFTLGDYVMEIRKHQDQYTIHALDSFKSDWGITALAYWKGNKQIIGTHNGCYMKTDGTWKKIPKTENLYVKHLTIDHEDNVWVASTTGIYVLKNGLIHRSYTVSNGLLNEFVYGILFDEEGNAWYSSNRGLGCILRKGGVKFFTEADGLQGDEFDTQSFWKGEDGKMFFGGINGITSFYPQDVLQSEAAGKIILSSLTVNGKAFPEEGRIDDVSTIELPYNQNALTIDFALTDFRDPGYNIYQVQMSDVDKSWVSLKNDHSARYVLNPGHYQFHIKGSSDGSTWSEEFILPVIIHPAWWQTYWFMAFAIASMTGILFLVTWAYNRRRTQRLKDQLQLQIEIQKERERISRDLHDNIGAYSSAMIANADYLEQQADGQPKEKILALKENARNILASIRETIWLLNNKNLTVSGFTEGLINYCTNILRNYDGIEIEFKEEIIVNSNISPALAINLLRVLQEAFQNTVKHAQATQINCIIHSSKERLSISIKDNGIGFDQTKKTFGNGLKNMQHRAAEINFELRITSEIGKGASIELVGKVP